MKKTSLSIALLACLSACVSLPNGPSVTVMPTPGKPFEVFHEEDLTCRAFAKESVGTSPEEAQASSAAKTAVLGAAIGAAAGALTGGSRSIGPGAAIGGVGGALLGSGSGNQSAYEVQRRYNIAYEQCMYSKGNQIPGYAIQRSPQNNLPPPNNNFMPPPPPPNYYSK